MRDLFLRACRGEPTEQVPVWFMRQAGRSLPEYRALRERHSILEMCRTPELATEVTLQPVRRLGVDAAILFSDIVVPLQGMGVDLDIEPGRGPVIAQPVRSSSDVARLTPLDPAGDAGYVLDAVKMLVSELDIPLIGFAGAPFTLASYLIEGGPSRDHARTKALMFSEPEVWGQLMQRLSDAVSVYLRAQVEAGASAIQLFDSWVGSLSPIDYELYVAPWVTSIFDGLDDLGISRIHFGVVTGELLQPMHATGCDVMGVDWRVPMDQARARLGEDVPLQGNLDPAILLAPWEVVAQRATDVLDRTGGQKHIFNLGHGVLPQTDPGQLARLVEHIHAFQP